MINIFDPLKKLLQLDKVRIDNNIFILHYKVTVIILMACSLLVSSRQYIGDPIDCTVDGIPQNVMDTYCWVHGTFTTPNRLNDSVANVSDDKVHLNTESNVDDGKDEVKHHKYYQWVCFALMIQAILFYVPRYMWNMWEGGRIKMLSLDINGPVVDEECKIEKKKILINYFYDNFNQHNSYAYHFFVCEILNFINVVGQFCFMNIFLDGEFSTYGSDVVRYADEDPKILADPMARVFPKVTKCIFEKYNKTLGSVQKFEGICVLPLNVLNEKIYAFLWFWFILLIFYSFISLVYRLAVVMGENVRFTLLRIRSPLSTYHEIAYLTDKCQIGDWFLLFLLTKNINRLIFKEVVTELTAKLKKAKIITFPDGSLDEIMILLQP